MFNDINCDITSKTKSIYIRSKASIRLKPYPNVTKASVTTPFDPNNITNVHRVTRRTTYDLPPHVKEQVFYVAERKKQFPDASGYYLYNLVKCFDRLVEFINHHWYYLFVHDRFYFTSLEDRIKRDTRDTGYWHTTDSKHTDYQPVASTSAIIVRNSAQSLLTDPALSPYVTARDEQSESSDFSTPESSSSDAEDICTPLQPWQEQVLAAQLQHVLGIVDWEPENPLTPDQLAYLNLVEQAVEAGVNVPSSPLLATPLTPLTPIIQTPLLQVPAVQMVQQASQFIGIPPQQQQQQQQQPATGGQAAAAALADIKLNGVPPTVFDRDRSMSEQFINEFAMYRALNHDHRIMANPYLQTVLALQYIKWPNVRDWANDQLRHLNTQIQPLNHVPTTL